MHLIDRYAYTNRIRAVDPAQKSGLAVVALLLCLGLNRPAVSMAAVGWMWGLATVWAGLPGLIFLRALLAEGAFLALAVVGAAISLHTAPLPPPAWAWKLGPLWLISSPASLDTALRLFTRALGGAAAMTFLALTTPMVDVIDLLRRMRTPELLLDLMTIIYRSIFVLLESLNRMHTAQDARLGYSNARRSMASAALLGSRLFLDAYQRSRRMQTALESRGYTSRLLVLPADHRRDPRAWWLGGAMLVSLLLICGLL